MSDGVADTLADRLKVHGDYTNVAHMCQRTKELWRESQNWSKLSLHQRETLEMIAHKVARILQGNPNHKDHWHDIQGYARLTEDRLP